MKPKFIEARKLFKNIPKIDFHLHTTYTDGIDKIEKYIKKADKIGIEEIAFTEHVDKSTDWFDNFKKEIIDYRQKNKSKLKIYHGIEVRALDYQGSLNAYPEIINSAELVVGVVHSYPTSNGGKCWPGHANLKKEEALDMEFRASLSLLSNKKVDVFGHPGATFEQFFGEFPPELYRKLIRLAKKNKKAIELNPQYQNNFPDFVKMCLEENPLISLGSNAHSCKKLGESYRKVKEIISKL